MSEVRIEPLRDDLAFGARVTGITEEALQDEALRESLRQTFEERGLIVFNGVEPTNRMQIALSKVFGKLND